MVDLPVYRWDELEEEVVKPGVRRRIVAGNKIMLVVYRIDPGEGISMHNHPHEQIGYIVEGEAEFEIGGEKTILRAGDIFHVPPNVPHAGKVIGDKPLLEIDIFHPIRENFRKK